MKTQNLKQPSIAHAAFVDALSGEFIARTGCGVYVHLDPMDVYSMFNEFQGHEASIRDYVCQVVKSFTAGSVQR